jgi:hypothetical protein
MFSHEAKLILDSIQNEASAGGASFTRLTHERIGVAISNSPGYKIADSEMNNLMRIQSASYSINQNPVQIKSVGSDDIIKIDGQAPVVRSPDVQFSLSYLFCEGHNENTIGFYLGDDGSVFKNYLSDSSGDDVNIFIVASNTDTSRDLNLQPLGSFDGFNVIGIGNAFLQSYEYQASVGSLPVCSLSYIGSNVEYNAYDSGALPEFPSFKLGVNNLKSPEKFSIDDNTFDSYFDSEPSVIKPGEIQVRFTKTNGSRGGGFIESIDAAIQSISINVGLDRQNIYGFGSNMPFDRKFKLPIIGEMSAEFVIRGFNQDQISSFFDRNNIYDIKIFHPIKPRLSGSEGSRLYQNGFLYFAVADGIWRRSAGVLDNSASSYDQVNIGEYNDFFSSQFYFANTGNNSWIKIPLSLTNLERDGEIGDIFHDVINYYIKTSQGWKNFPLSEINPGEIDRNDAFQIAKYLVYEINDAQLNQEAFSFAIEKNATISCGINFPVSKTKGLKTYLV